MVRDGSGIVQAVLAKERCRRRSGRRRTPRAGVSLELTGARQGRQARARAASSWTSPASPRVQVAARLSDHAQGARHGVPDGAPPPVAALAAPARRSCACAPRSCEGHPRLLRRRSGFTLVDAPIFTPAACEGTTTLFEVAYFDEGKAYLTQSGQLYMEARGRRSARSTASARRSAPRSPRRAATSPSSGWSSPRSPSRTSTTTWTSPRTVVSHRRARARARAARS